MLWLETSLFEKLQAIICTLNEEVEHGQRGARGKFRDSVLSSKSKVQDISEIKIHFRLFSTSGLDRTGLVFGT